MVLVAYWVPPCCSAVKISIERDVDARLRVNRSVMLHQRLLANQPFPADFALERIHLPAVVPLVNVQRVLQLESFVANAALEGAALRVGGPVRLEVALVSEAFPAGVAGESLVLVLLHVLDEVVLVAELLEARWTLVAQEAVGGQRRGRHAGPVFRLSSVPLGVAAQRNNVAFASSAQGALEGLLSGARVEGARSAGQFP